SRSNYVSNNSHFTPLKKQIASLFPLITLDLIVLRELLKLQILLSLLKYNNLYHQTYIPPQSGHEHVEIAKVKDGTSKGIFDNNYSLNHVIPVEGNNLFMNEISYNTNIDAYCKM
ncbi:8852_t:CDS:2, partial [Rhizophagus irregularis]